MKALYAYRLDVEYPEGSQEEGWEPPNYVRDVVSFGHREWEEVPFRWPTAKPYLSHGGAYRRAQLLRSYGAKVTIIRSKPVEWD